MPTKRYRMPSKHTPSILKRHFTAPKGTFPQPGPQVVALKSRRRGCPSRSSPPRISGGCGSSRTPSRRVCLHSSAVAGSASLLPQLLRIDMSKRVRESEEVAPARLSVADALAAAGAVSVSGVLHVTLEQLCAAEAMLPDARRLVVGRCSPTLEVTSPWASAVARSSLLQEGELPLPTAELHAQRLTRLARGNAAVAAGFVSATQARGLTWCELLCPPASHEPSGVSAGRGQRRRLHQHGVKASCRRHGSSSIHSHLSLQRRS